MRVWADASTLIALDRVGELLILRRLVTKVSVTEEVAEEVFTGRESPELRAARGDWIVVARVRGDRRRWASLGLGPGEASLFLTPPADTVILDDRAARLAAQAEGRAVVGLLGLLLGAARDGRLSRGDARRVLGKLARSGFHLSGPLLSAANEELARPRDDRA